MTTLGESIFKKVFKTITWEKNVGKILFLSSCYNDEIKFNAKTRLYTDEKLFELYCTENDLAKHFENFAIYLNILFRT